MALRDVPLDCSFNLTTVCAEACSSSCPRWRGGAIQKPSDKMGGSIQLEKSEYPTLQPDGPKTAGGRGKPRQCQPPGKERQFHDGAGLSSMGRWDVEQRVWCEDSFWTELRGETMKLILQHLPDSLSLDRACFEMAVKGEEGCGIVKNETLKQRIRDLWITLLQKHGSQQEDLGYKAAGQPFFLRLMKELLAFAGDADREFLLQGESGFPVWGDQSITSYSPHLRGAD